MAFDPYHKWLGIPPDQQPASHYRLLAIEEFESDADVIEAAAERQTGFLRTFQTGPDAELAERLLNEVAAARVCLLRPAAKAEYDASLRNAITDAEPPPAIFPAEHEQLSRGVSQDVTELHKTHDDSKTLGSILAEEYPPEPLGSPRPLAQSRFQERTRLDSFLMPVVVGGLVLTSVIGALWWFVGRGGSDDVVANKTPPTQQTPDATAAENAAAAKAAANKRDADKLALERAAAEQDAEKVAAEKAVAETLAAEKAEAEKAAMERAAAEKRDNGWVRLFNGRDLTGWVNVNCNRDTFSVRNAVLYCNGNADGFIRTERQYTNFILEVDWRHLENKGNSGLFIWCGAESNPGDMSPTAVEVQILTGYRSPGVTSHGDIHPINGAFMVPDRRRPAGGMRCLPREHRCHPAGQWNNYRLSCTDGTIKLAVNGKEVSGGSQALPRSGYIGLQSQGSSVEFRNIRLRASLSGKSN